MGAEVDERRIRTLEMKIKAATGDSTELRIARNSLLNISTRVPTEILALIFYWIVLERRHLPRIRPCSYYFLLVCQHWYQVAMRTPALWSLWGHTLALWLRRFKRSGTTPVDLVLNGYVVGGPSAPLDEPIREALRDRMERNTLKSVQLWNERKSVLEDVLAALTPPHNVVRTSSVETICLRVVDASQFMSRHCFPKLTYLRLSMGTKVIDWGRVAMSTTALTTLALTFDDHGIPTFPTIAELVSLLASNPTLRDVSFTSLWTDRTQAYSTPSRVPMHNLQRLTIDGDHRSTLELVQQIAYPNDIEHISLTVAECEANSVLATLGVLAHDRLYRQLGRNPIGLGIFVHCFPNFFSLQADGVKDSKEPVDKHCFSRFSAYLAQPIANHELVQLSTDFISNVPGEEVIFFRAELSMEIIRRTITTMPNITELYLVCTQLEAGFLQPESTVGSHGLLPSLTQLHLKEVTSDQGSWHPLLEFLDRQTRTCRPLSLTILGAHDHICKHTLQEMANLVEKLQVECMAADICPFDRCGESDEGRDE